MKTTMKTSRLAILAAAALALALTGCLQHTVSIGTGAPEGALVYKNWHHHWLFGLIRPEHQEELDLAAVCPSGNATLHEETSFVNGLVDALTWFIYSPTTVTILCDDGTETEIALSAGDVSRVIHDPRFPELVAEVAPARLAEAQAALEDLRLAERAGSAPDTGASPVEQATRAR